MSTHRGSSAPWIASLTLLTACAATTPAPSTPSTPAGGKAGATEGKFDVEALLAHEAMTLPPVKISDSEGSFTASAEATSAPAVKKEPQKENVLFSFELAIGSEVTIDCTIDTERRDAGSTIQGMVAGIKPEIAPQREVKQLSAGVIDGHPWIAISVLYLTKEKQVGVLKAAVVNFTSSSLICFHDEPGYEKTFQRVVSQLASSLKWKVAEPTPRMHQVALLSLQGNPIGYAEDFVYELKEGGTQEQSYFSFAMPRSSSDVVSHDNVEIAKVDTGGRVVDKVSVTSAGGEVNGTVHLVWKGKSGYAADGEVEGKKFHADLDSSRGLLGTRAEATQLAKAARAQDKKPLAFDAYSIERDPQKIKSSSYTFVGPAEGGGSRFKIVDDELTLEGSYDKNGLPTEMEIPLGSFKLSLKRAHIDGAP